MTQPITTPGQERTQLLAKKTGLSPSMTADVMAAYHKILAKELKSQKTLYIPKIGRLSLRKKKGKISAQQSIDEKAHSYTAIVGSFRRCASIA